MIFLPGDISIGRREWRLPGDRLFRERLLVVGPESWHLHDPIARDASSPMGRVLSSGPTYDLTATRKRNRIEIEIQVDGSLFVLTVKSGTFNVSEEFPLILSLFEDNVPMNMKKLFDLERQAMTSANDDEPGGSSLSSGTTDLSDIRFEVTGAPGHLNKLVVSSKVLGLLGVGNGFAQKRGRALLIFEASGIRLITNRLDGDRYRELAMSYKSIHNIEVKEAFVWRGELSFDPTMRKAMPSRFEDSKLRRRSRRRGRIERNFVIRIETLDSVTFLLIQSNIGPCAVATGSAIPIQPTYFGSSSMNYDTDLLYRLSPVFELISRSGGVQH
ncbi:MAG: hypothetical protein ABSC34_12315 [Acidimicrobiales bacterium]|jgi:hypothetical protein